MSIIGIFVMAVLIGAGTVIASQEKKNDGTTSFAVAVTVWSLIGLSAAFVIWCVFVLAIAYSPWIGSGNDLDVGWSSLVYNVVGGVVAAAIGAAILAQSRRRSSPPQNVNKS